jgi:hypothetical protein
MFTGESLRTPGASRVQLVWRLLNRSSTKHCKVLGSIPGIVKPTQYRGALRQLHNALAAVQPGDTVKPGFTVSPGTTV